MRNGERENNAVFRRFEFTQKQTGFCGLGVLMGGGEKSGVARTTKCVTLIRDVARK
jgi:hypothetical protein